LILYSTDNIDGEFLASTGRLNAIAVERINFRPQKTHVEFCFEVVPESDERSVALRGDVTVDEVPKQALTKPKVAVQKTNTKTIATYSEELVDFFFQRLEKQGHPVEGQQDLRRALLAECNLTLNTVQNTSFAAGFKAK
jgi:hypothetical protein